MGAKRERGAYGNARGIPDKQVRRKRVRENDPRYQAAMEEVRRNQAIIDQLAADNEAAERASTARREQLRYVKAEVEQQTQPKSPSTEEAVPVTEQPSRPIPTGHRFAPCWCTHSRDWHEGNVKPACGECGCSYYRPNTAPDPLAATASAVSKIEQLIQYGKESDNKRTVAFALKVEAMCVDLKDRVEDELIEKAEREQREKQAIEARERVAKLAAELAEAQQLLKQIAPKKAARKPASKMVGPAIARRVEKGTHGGVSHYGKYECPTCGDVKDTPQGLGAHRSRAHGYRKGDDEREDLR